LAAVETLDAISICVPTPRRITGNADLSYLLAGVEAVHNHLTTGKLIILESTISPGTTRNTVLPILQKSGRQAGRDFFLAYSPKPKYVGNKTSMKRDIPKVIGGMTPRCAALAALFYQQFAKRIIRVSSLESAEMVKFIEVTFRSVNSALANEMARLCATFGVDIWEVIDAAKFTRFESMPFSPGAATTGNPISAEPSNLSELPSKPLLVEVADLVNGQLPRMASSRIADILNKNKMSINGCHILALGIAQTRDRHDVRDSLCLEILKSLHEKGAIVSYSDPHVFSIELDGQTLTSTAISSDILNSKDCVVILTDHSAFDYRAIIANSRLVLDCRNALRRRRADNVIPV
jgi:UDP-N-acetyl-D-glucosamine dehydrogenase